MKILLSFIIVIVIMLFPVLAGQSLLPDEDIPGLCWGDPLVVANLNESTRFEVREAQVLSPDEDCVPTGEVALIFRQHVLWDADIYYWSARVDLVRVGHTPELLLRDMTGDGERELLFRYKSGAHQTILEVHDIWNYDLQPIENATFTSNMADIRFTDKGCLELSNQFFEDMEGNRRIRRQTYCYENGRFQLKNKAVTNSQ